MIIQPLRLIKNALRRVTPLRELEIAEIEKIGENLTPNMRALRLVMTIAERLLSMGVAASDVVHMCLGITNTYCKRRVHIDISYTQINVSQDRGIDREPLTLIRTIIPDDANYQQIQALQSLALKIRNSHIPLEEAETIVDQIISDTHEHPRWIIYCSGGAVSAGVVLLYDGSPLMIAMSFLVGFATTVMLRWMGKIGVSTFYTQIIAAFLVTISAALAVVLNTYLNLQFNPTIIVIGGIVLLVAGMMIVGAFQDAIDEYYVTANARLLKVLMATSGIVIGVLGGLFVATKFHISFPATPDRLGLADTQTQYLGALVIAAFFALRNHITFGGMLVAGGVGAFGWWISRLALAFDLGTVIISGVAAAIVGILATFVSRFWRIPSLAIIAAGIVPLVPGLSLYEGLMGIVAHPPGDVEFMYSLAVLARAVMIGFTVAAGATLGNMIGRPIRRRIIRVYNRLPKRKLRHELIRENH